MASSYLDYPHGSVQRELVIVRLAEDDAWHDKPKRTFESKTDQDDYDLRYKWTRERMADTVKR